MFEQQLKNYFDYVFQPWYNTNVSFSSVPLNHPLYFFQIQTNYNYTVQQAISLIFRISQLRIYAVDLLIISTIYMRRLVTNISYLYGTNYVYSTTNITTIFFICLLLASKYSMDDSIDNKEIYRIAYNNRITLDHFNYLEVKLLELLDYKLYIDPEEYNYYEKIININ